MSQYLVSYLYFEHLNDVHSEIVKNDRCDSFDEAMALVNKLEKDDHVAWIELYELKNKTEGEY